jgi:hypothetical protein
MQDPEPGFSGRTEAPRWGWIQQYDQRDEPQACGQQEARPAAPRIEAFKPAHGTAPFLATENASRLEFSQEVPL